MKIRAKLLKSQKLEDGSVSYLLKGDGEDKAVRHAAIDLEGEECEIGRAPNGDQAQVQTPVEIMLADLQHKAEKLLEAIAEMRRSNLEEIA